MTRLVHDYVRFTGDDAFLDEAPGRARRSLDHLRDWALAWQDLRRIVAARRLRRDREPARVRQLLHPRGRQPQRRERVEPAHRGRGARPAHGDADGGRTLRAEADDARRRTCSSSIVPGTRLLRRPAAGRHPAAGAALLRLQHRRHHDRRRPRPEQVAAARWSTSSSANCRPRDWMRALSPWDPDASFSVRPDHQWNGAYPAWPADAARALVALGAPEVALDWLPGPRPHRQPGPARPGALRRGGPAAASTAGRARPRRSCRTSSTGPARPSGAYVALVIESLFGVDARRLDGTSTRSDGCIADLDPPRGASRPPRRRPARRRARRRPRHRSRA